MPIKLNCAVRAYWTPKQSGRAIDVAGNAPRMQIVPENPHFKYHYNITFTIYNYQKHGAVPNLQTPYQPRARIKRNREIAAAGRRSRWI